VAIRVPMSAFVYQVLAAAGVRSACGRRPGNSSGGPAGSGSVIRRQRVRALNSLPPASVSRVPTRECVRHQPSQVLK
jgi:hypothetical protein